MRPSRKSLLQQEMRENFAHFSRLGATTSQPPELGNLGPSSKPVAPQTPLGNIRPEKRSSLYTDTRLFYLCRPFGYSTIRRSAIRSSLRPQARVKMPDENSENYLNRNITQKHIILKRSFCVNDSKGSGQPSLTQCNFMATMFCQGNIYKKDF